ncbi:MAG: trypsin-like peptidase domain-containing protein [Pirellulales bacterium]|nr:trypsin-like peptidase domain-containing protein [Pirellulales bacterium]
MTLALLIAAPARAGANVYPPQAHLRSDVPHPAVARIVVPENGATSYGSGVLVDVRDDFGLVITNWHVVRDAAGTVEVILPGGFTSKARPLKVDSDWDLAALVIWRPPAAPVEIAPRAPQPGEQLTICGYGPGIYRSATGRCTQYYSPRVDLPQHMVELNVEARQGDSGGPIFNERGELAGVLFGAGEGTTLGSFGGRVGNFLASLAPDIGRGSGEAPPVRRPEFALASTMASAELQGASQGATATVRGGEQASPWAPGPAPAPVIGTSTPQSATTPGASAPAALNPWGEASSRATAAAPGSAAGGAWLDTFKTALAAIGVVALAAQALKLVR